MHVRPPGGIEFPGPALCPPRVLRGGGDKNVLSLTIICPGVALTRPVPLSVGYNPLRFAMGPPAVGRPRRR
jgi:hypothetical protein